MNTLNKFPFLDFIKEDEFKGLDYIRPIGMLDIGILGVNILFYKNEMGFVVRRPCNEQRILEFGTITDDGVFKKESLTIFNVSVSEVVFYVRPRNGSASMSMDCNYKTTLQLLSNSGANDKVFNFNFQKHIVFFDDFLHSFCNVINTTNIVLLYGGDVDKIVIERLNEGGILFPKGCSPDYPLQFDYIRLLDLKVSFFNCWMYKYRTDDAFWREVEIKLPYGLGVNTYLGKVLIEALNSYCHSSYGVKVLDDKLLCEEYESNYGPGSGRTSREKISDDLLLQKELIMRLVLTIPKIYKVEEHRNEIYRLGYSRITSLPIKKIEDDKGLPF
jgi:hypothetical protein